MDNELRKKIIDEFASGNVAEATELLLENEPQYLYKYRSGKSYDIDALKKKKLWISRATEVDDEEDGKIYIEDIFKQALKLMQQENNEYKAPKYEETVNHISDITKQEVFICSFSEVCENDDMWKRYANDSSGFCIEYNFKDLFIKDLICLPVSYEEKSPLGPAEFKTKESMFFSALYRKNMVGENGEDWNGQREWRWACYEKTLGLSKDENGMLISAPMPHKIIVGRNASALLKEQLQEAIDYLGENIPIVAMDDDRVINEGKDITKLVLGSIKRE